MPVERRGREEGPYDRAASNVNTHEVVEAPHGPMTIQH